MRTAGFVVGTVLAVAASAAVRTAPQNAQPVPANVYGGKILLPQHVACTDQPVTVVALPSLRIIAPHAGDLREGAATNQLVVLNGGTPHGFAIGQRYFTRRLAAPLDHSPISVDKPASLQTTGWLTVVAADERFALGRVDHACVMVESGDYLEPYVEPAAPATPAADAPPDFADMARVLFGRDRHERFGQGDLLSIDRGSARGLALGTRVSFYRDRRLGTPLYELGAGVVVEVWPDSAKVVVERAYPDVEGGDYAVIRK
jgi:hypothetical protein